MKRLAVTVIALGTALGSAHAGSLLDDIDREQAAAAELAHGVATAALADDAPALRTATARVVATDAARRTADRPPTGLAGDARLLSIALLPTAAARRTPLDDLVDHSTGDLHRLAAGLQASDDAARTTRLLADDRHDRRAAFVNDAIRPFGLGSNLLAVINPVLLAGSAIDAVVATTRNVLRYDDLSVRQRDALASYHAAVARNAGGERDPELARATQTLAAKQRRALCANACDEADDALDDGALARAATRLRAAAAIGDCDTTDLDARLAAARRAAAARADAAVWPEAEPALPRSPTERAAWSALAVALLGDDPATIARAAQRLEAADPDGPLAPGAALARATALNLSGDTDRARDALEDLADDDTPIGQLAEGLESGPGYGDADAIRAAERTHRAAVARYVAVGGVSGTNALQSAAHVAAYGASGLQSLGITNAIGVLARAYRAWRHDPAPNEAVITSGEAYLARHPDAADRDAVHEQLVTAYARAERYDRALLHARAVADPDLDRIEDLEDDLADQMLERARHQDADPALLAAIATHFPSTDAADKARTALEKRLAAGVAISREELERHPDLLGPDGLGLRPGLLDGDDDNGELGSEGVRLHATEMELHLEPEDDTPPERLALDASTARRAYAAAETLLYRESLAREKTGDEHGRFEDYVPFFITGTFGDSGVNVYPGVKMRPYDDAHPERFR